jgi:hypothetical protein
MLVKVALAILHHVVQKLVIVMHANQVLVVDYHVTLLHAVARWMEELSKSPLFDTVNKNTQSIYEFLYP